MLTIYDDATLRSALSELAATPICDTVNRIAYDAKASGLWELTCILVLQGGADATEPEHLLGFNPLGGPLQDSDQPFMPYWSWLERHEDHFEMLLTAGDEGFAYFVLVPDSDASPLAGLLRRHTGNLES